MKILVLVLLLSVGCYESHEVAQKQTIVRPSGVVTQPNEVGLLEPGTLSRGDGVQMRRQGVLEPRLAFNDYHSTPGSFPGSDRAVKAWQYDEDKVLTVVRNNGGTGTSLAVLLDDGSTKTVGYSGPPTFAFSPGKTFITNTRDRVIITNDYAPAVIDPQEALVAYSARQAGLPMPSVIDIDETTAGNVWLDTKYIAYRALFKLTDESYVIRGAVSAPFMNVNAVGDAAPHLTVYWDSSLTPLSTDVEIELYRVEQQDSADLLGDRFRLAGTYRLTSTDISNGFAEIVDNCVDGALGADLYTNGSQEGAAKANWMPPYSEDVVTFKGATFYLSKETWHTVQVNIPNAFGTLTGNEARTAGIGKFTETGTTTTATNTITAVANVTGIAIGQYVNHPAFVAGTKVTAISGSGPYTVTVNHNASLNDTGAIQYEDVITIAGVEYSLIRRDIFLRNLGQDNASGDNSVVISGSGQFLDVSPSTTAVNGFSLTLARPVSGSAGFTVSATRGSNYNPPLPITSNNDPRTNRLHFSKIAQPEAVSPDQYLFVGEGTILKMWATQEALFVFCTDGIYRIDGDGDDWSVSPFDPDTILLAPDAVDSMDNMIFALTTAGFVSVSDASGVQKISSPIIGDQIRDLSKQFQNDTQEVLPYTWGVQLACDKYRNEVWLNFNDYDGEGQIQTWIWNTDTSTFFTQSQEETILCTYIPFLHSILLDHVTDITSTVRVYFEESIYMQAYVEFNSIFGTDAGVLKQWIDVTLLLELWSGGSMLPTFNGVEYPDEYQLAEDLNPSEHVIVPLQDYVYNKQIRFGFITLYSESANTTNWQLKGLTFRYRDASETLRQ